MRVEEEEGGVETRAVVDKSEACWVSGDGVETTSPLGEPDRRMDS